jgi:ABC-type glycerol-3-phosphate transport system permease component
MCAYPLAKHQFYGKNMIFRVITFALLFAGGVTSLPLYIILSRLGLVNTYFALVLPQIASPLGLFLMCQFMKVIPDELIEAAKLDGAKEVQILFRLVMPLVRPAWMTLVIFAFQAIWNVTGENLIYTENYKLLPSLMSQVAAAGLARAGAAAAAAFIMMVPPIVIFMISQKKVIETMSYSGLKG